MTAGTTLRLTVAGSGERLPVRPERLVVAGYTAADEASVARHIEELAAIGVPPPPAVPMFYPLDPALLSTDARIRVPGPATSGEVEPVLVRHRGTYYLGVGSDHTDRVIERRDIAASKAACPKPVGGSVLEIGPDLSFPQWHEVQASCAVDGQPYQEGAVSSLRHPADLLDRYERRRRTINIEFVQQQTVDNKQRLEEKDPRVRRAKLDRLAEISADDKAQRLFLRRTSLLDSVVRGREID
jgi:4-hydroxyphenylacetate 3-monooxygenase